MIKRLWLFIVLWCAFIPAATTGAQQDTATSAVTLRLSISDLPGTLDPAAADYLSAIQQITNLFIGLTDYDPETLAVIPKLATSWETDAAGQIWTFHLRADVPWVSYDPDTATVESQRMVTADDVVYSLRRLCSNPDFGYYVTDIFAPVIAGCEAALASRNGTNVGVTAPDDTTVVITLTAPYSIFLEMTPLWTVRPVPREAIEAYGETWILPGNIWTSGPFTLAGLDQDNGMTLVSNPDFPAAIRGPGNVERVEIWPWSYYELDLFEMGYLAQIEIPASGRADWLEYTSTETQLTPNSSRSITYFGFTADKAPTDNVHVRRALTAAIDREAFLQEFQGGQGIPLAHFTPPDVVDGPPLAASFDVGYDPEYARQQMREAGYPDCEGLPSIAIAITYGYETWLEFIVAGWERELGCDPRVFEVSSVNSYELEQMTDPHAPLRNRPHIWSAGWYPDYNHAQTYIGLLVCSETNSLARECTAVDNLIVKAQTTTDLTLRGLLYLSIEEAFFGPEGEFPVIPLFQDSAYTAAQPWNTGPHATDGAYVGRHYDYYTIDTSSCAIVAASGAVPLYRSPALSAAVVGTLAEGESLPGIGQTTDAEGLLWWQLENEAWVLDWDVRTEGFCELLPVIAIPNV